MGGRGKGAEVTPEGLAKVLLKHVRRPTFIVYSELMRKGETEADKILVVKARIQDIVVACGGKLSLNKKTRSFGKLSKESTTETIVQATPVKHRADSRQHNRQASSSLQRLPTWCPSCT